MRKQELESEFDIRAVRVAKVPAGRVIAQLDELDSDSRANPLRRLAGKINHHSRCAKNPSPRRRSEVCNRYTYGRRRKRARNR